MDWYYAVGGEQKGPVNEDDLQRLAHQGVVNAQTLVWREGLDNWQPYAAVARGAAPLPPPAMAPNIPPGGGVLCASCRRTFPGSEVISLGGSLYCAACKPIALQRLREGGTASGAEEIRNDHLKHEASVKSVGLLYYLGGAGLILMGAVSILASLGGSGGPEVVVGIAIAAVILVLGAGQIWVGTGLRRLKRWARIPTGILSGIGLLGFPLGTLINGYILYLVFCQKGKMVFSDEYQAVIEQTPHIKYRTSILVWILLGLVLLLIGLGIIGMLVGGSR